VDKDIYFMNEVIKLAKTGVGKTGYNPSVGCLIVRNDQIISKARTKNGGRPHAEHIAISKANSKELIGSTIYISLEPCCINKADKISCIEKIITSKISRVVIGTIDPNPEINGKSIEILKKHNIKTKIGILNDKCEELILGFKKRIISSLPYITLKLATSLDGKIALFNKKSKWITSEKLRYSSHKLRAKNEAILTGIGTVIADDPLLTCRLNNKNHANPIRIIIDTNLKIPQNSKILKTAKKIQTIIFTNKKSIDSYHGANVIYINKTKDGLNLKEILHHITNLGINNLLIEAGQKISTSFIKENLVDQIVLYQSKKIIGGDGIDAIGNLNISDMSQCIELKAEIVYEK
jgi:diaminohydroxyphosphoribosylaminopyrimidine deaminase/5-amino-6-(5-phosphoribosylamino)uracil reductase